MQATERPMLFSAPMVRAILAGTKTQTRRAIKFKPWHQIEERDDGAPWPWMYDSERDACHWVACPYGQPGNRLWAREAFRFCAEADHIPPRDTDSAYRVWHEADAPHQPGAGKLRPGMFMPRWASRILLEVAAVRVERLQAISEADAQAEGIVETYGGFGLPAGEHYHAADPRQSYFSLWEAINGPGSVEANPWVWAVSFRRVTS